LLRCRYFVFNCVTLALRESFSDLISSFYFFKSSISFLLSCIEFFKFASSLL
jgi:hypothetical protein